MIYTALDDFKKRTLSQMPTLLEKLAYISSLQTETGAYRHWGLIRKFGHQLAQHAMSTAHFEAATELIRLPMRDAYEQYLAAIDHSNAAQFMTPESLALTSPANDDELLAAHLRLIQNAIAALARQADTTRPGA